MRIKNALALASALIVIGTSISIAQPALADDAPLSGNWKLVVLPFGDDDFAIFKLSPKGWKDDRQPSMDAQQMLRSPKVKAVEQKDGSFTISLSRQRHGHDPSRDGSRRTVRPPAKFLGMVNFGGSSLPRTRRDLPKTRRSARSNQSPLIAKLA